MADILPYLEVKRNYKPEDVESKLITVADLTGLNAKQAKQTLAQQGLEAVLQGDGEVVTSQIPAAGHNLPGGSQVLVYMGQQPQESLVSVPDLAGMTRVGAYEAAGLVGLYILPAGNTDLAPEIQAVSQSPAPGTQVPVGSTITVTFSDTKTIP